MQKIETMIDKYVADAIITVDLRINCEFKDFMDELPHNHNGIYIIYEQNGEDTTVVYVGKGKIKTRQKRHRQKLIETPQKSDPLAWRWFRNKRGFDYDKLKLIALFFNGDSAMTCLEGNLVHHLQPLLNNETFKGDLK